MRLRLVQKPGTVGELAPVGVCWARGAVAQPAVLLDEVCASRSSRVQELGAIWLNLSAYLPSCGALVGVGRRQIRGVVA